MWWLFTSDLCDDAVAHVHFHSRPTYKSRVHARTILADLPGADLLFSVERPKEDGETDEPRHLRRTN